MKIGDRIAEARRQLGLSQARFAERAGISLSSQKRYESGERAPDTSYLDSLRSIGVDVDYLLTGQTSSDAESDKVINGLIELLRAVGARLGSPKEAVEAAWQEALANPAVFRDGGTVSAAFVDALIDRRQIELDGALLGVVLESIEDAQSVRGCSLSPDKKAKVAVILYRAFKASGQIDRKMIDEAVTLAAG